MSYLLKHSLAALFLALACAGFGTLAAAESTYVAAPIRGVVVAADTGRPLSGASMLAVWAGMPDVNAMLAVNTVRVLEAESKADGTFVIAGWQATALRVPVTRDWPRLLCFAAGRAPMWLDAKLVMTTGPVEIRMPRFVGTPKEWAEQVGEVIGTLAIAWVPLYGEPLPRILHAIEVERQRLPAALRDGPDTRQAFEWIVREYRSAYEQRKLEP